MSSLMQYLIQQSKEFHDRVDGTEETLEAMRDEIAVLEYNVLKILKSIQEDIHISYKENDNEDIE